MTRSAFAAAVVVALVPAIARGQDYGSMQERAKYPLAEAIERGMKVAKGEGTVFEVELEHERGKTVYSVDIAQGAKVLNVVLDAGDGSIVEQEVEDEDHSKVVQAAKITVGDAIRTALGKGAGKAVHARLVLKEGAPEVRVLLAAEGKTTLVVVNAASGEAAGASPGGKEGADEDEDKFTDAFGEEIADFGPTGRNPYFVLEPGWTIELGGRKGEKEIAITITVLDVTKTIAGVETRAVEEKEIVDGQVKESTRDYFAISRRTNNVYYFGEDVDMYEDGKVVGHEGAWLAGEKGARYGLFMPGVPLLGARYYQEIAPGVAMDRGEIVSLSETLECPAGKFENVLKVVESSDIEKGSRETNLYARGIGPIMDDDLKLVRYGKKQ